MVPIATRSAPVIEPAALISKAKSRPSGPEIGVARYRSTHGVGVFWSFRFEIG
jgi:hypothetical protein